MKRALRASTPAAVRASLVKVANEVRNGELSPQQGNAIISAMNVILSSIRLDDQEAKIAELEKLLADMRGEVR